MKKVIVSLLVLAFVALAATGTVSAQCAAKATTTSVATTCAQCTSCTTSTCCTCACPVTSCCPTVACCVVTQCCAVKTVAMPVWTPVVKTMAVWKPYEPVVVKPAANSASAAAKGGLTASAASTAATQTITQTQSAVITGNYNNVTFASQTANNEVHTTINTAVAWGTNSTAANQALIA